MSGTVSDTRTLLEALRVEIRRGHFRAAGSTRRIVAWKGPGAAFMTREKFSGPARFGLRGEPVAVVTPHAHAAAWLLGRLDSAFAPLLGTQLRWDFFERIGEAVIDYGAFLPPELDSDENLLLVILREAADVLDEMEAGEFPCVFSEEDSEDRD